MDRREAATMWEKQTPRRNTILIWFSIDYHRQTRHQSVGLLHLYILISSLWKNDLIQYKKM